MKFSAAFCKLFGTVQHGVMLYPDEATHPDASAEHYAFDLKSKPPAPSTAAPSSAAASEDDDHDAACEHNYDANDVAEAEPARAVLPRIHPMEADSILAEVTNCHPFAALSSAVEAYAAVDKELTFQKARALSHQVKSFLPNKNNLQEDLKQKVEAVQKECDAFSTTFLMEFVETIRDGNIQIEMLAKEIAQLESVAHSAIERVKHGQAAWDPAVLRQSVNSCKKKYDDVIKFVDEKAAVVNEKLKNHIGNAMMDLSNEIYNAGYDESMETTLKQAGKDQMTLLSVKQDANERAAKLKFLQAEQSRLAQQLTDAARRMQAAQTKLASAKREVEACEALKRQRAEEAHLDAERRARELEQEKNARLAAIQDDTHISDLRRRSQEAANEAADVVAAGLQLTDKTASELPVNFVVMLDTSGEMLDQTAGTKETLGLPWQYAKQVLNWIASKQIEKQSSGASGPVNRTDVHGSRAAAARDGAAPDVDGLLATLAQKTFSQSAARSRDKVTLIGFDWKQSAMLLKSDWNKIGSALTKREGEPWVNRQSKPNFTRLFNHVKDLAPTLKPMDGTQMRTHFLLLTTGRPYDNEQPASYHVGARMGFSRSGYYHAAEDMVKAFSPFGPVSSLLVFLGEDAGRDMKMNSLITAMNNGKQHFEGITGEPLEYYSVVGSTEDATQHAHRICSLNDLQHKFSVLTDYSNKDVFKTSMKFSYANDQCEMLNSLLQKEEDQMAARQEKAVQHYKDSLTELQQSKEWSTATAEALAERRKAAALDSVQSCQQYIKKVDQHTKKLRSTEVELAKDIENATAEAEEARKLYEGVATTVNYEALLQEHSNKLQAARDRFGEMNPEQLCNVLNNAKELIVNTRFAFGGMLASFEQVSYPVGEAIQRLHSLQTAKVDITAELAMTHVIQMHIQEGMIELQAAGCSHPDNWKRIVAFHCPRAGAAWMAGHPDGEDTDVELFCDCVPFESVIRVCFLERLPHIAGEDEEDGTRRGVLQEHKERGVIRKKMTQELLRKATQSSSDISDKLEPLEEKMAELDELISELTEELDDLKSDLRAASKAKKDDKVDQYTEKIDKLKEKLRKAEAAKKLLQTQIEKLLEKRYHAVYDMLRPVLTGVLAVFGKVVLCLGIQETGDALASLSNMFKQDILPYCVHSKQVSRAFLSAGLTINTSLDLALTAAPPQHVLVDISKYCLADECPEE